MWRQEKPIKDTPHVPLGWFNPFQPKYWVEFIMNQNTQGFKSFFSLLKIATTKSPATGMEGITFTVGILSVAASLPWLATRLAFFL